MIFIIFYSVGSVNRHIVIHEQFFFSPITLLFIRQCHIGVYEEMFDVKKKIAQTMQNI